MKHIKVVHKMSSSDTLNIDGQIFWGSCRESFFNSFVEKGYAESVVRQYDRCFDNITALFISKTLHSIFYSECEIERNEHKILEAVSKGTKVKSLTIFRHYYKYLLSHGKINQATVKPETDPWINSFYDFSGYLETIRGLKESTAKQRVTVLKQLYSQFRNVFTGSPQHLTGKSVLELVHYFGPKVYIVTTLRSYLQFLYNTGITHQDLSRVLPKMPRKQDQAPKFISQEKVEIVLRGIGKTNPKEKRDFLMVLFVSRLGLRSAEVVSILLADIDWRLGEIFIRGKGNKNVTMPFSNEIAGAITAYLMVRPKTKSQHLFVQTKAPYNRFKYTPQISKTLKSALFKARIQYPGDKVYSNLLRHSFATNKLRREVPIHVISDLLRHKSVETTLIYAKFDRNTLLDVAVDWPMEKRKC